MIRDVASNHKITPAESLAFSVIFNRAAAIGGPHRLVDFIAAYGWRRRVGALGPPAVP